MLTWDSALGIEIQGENLVLATVKRGLRDYSLGSVALIENFRNRPVGELRSALEQYLKSNGFNRDKVILGLPRERAVVREVELPLEVEENLQQVVRFQVERFEPNEEVSCCYDFTVLERDEKGKKIRLQIVLVPGEEVDGLLTVFQEAGLYPSSIRISSLGLHQILQVHQRRYTESPVLLLNVHSDSLEMVLVGGAGEYRSSKSLKSGEPWTLEEVLREVDLFLGQEHAADLALARIYLSGSEADRLYPELRNRVEECELLRQKLQLQRPSPVPSLDQVLGAAGLALSGLGKSPLARLNLIPAEKRLVGQRPSLLPTVMLALCLLLLAGVALTREYWQQQRLLGQIEAQIEVLRPEVERSLQLRNQIEEVKTQLKELHQIVRGRQKVLRVLKELTEKIPENSFLQNVTVQGDKVSLTGYAQSASSLLTSLGLNSQNLHTLESRYITPDPRLGMEKFSFEAQIRPEKGEGEVEEPR